MLAAVIQLGVGLKMLGLIEKTAWATRRLLLLPQLLLIAY